MEEYKYRINLQLFADAGTSVNITTNGTTGTVNAYTGAYDTSKTTTHSMSATMKEYYDTELLENAREKLVFAQLGKKQPLPRNHGKTVEWRKFKTFDKAMTPLQEAVIPTGKTFGIEAINVTVQQFGDYVAISDVLDMHAVDNVILAATEEMGAAAGATADTLVRNELVTGLNVMYADTVDASTGAKTKVTARSGLAATNNRFTPDTVNQAVTAMKKNKVPPFAGGKYVSVIHPSVSYDLRSSKEWIEAHKYDATTEIFNGEIGELHGMRFIETTEAPIVKQGTGSSAFAVYQILCFGKDAFGDVDPEGMGMEMIIKNRDEVGGPLEQFSTVGYKFETATKILYPERLLRVECCSEYSTVDDAN
jgi:N4-gp56 family major capsid protein